MTFVEEEEESAFELQITHKKRFTFLHSLAYLKYILYRVFWGGKP